MITGYLLLHELIVESNFDERERDELVCPVRLSASLVDDLAFRLLEQG